jgi:hypothetical protein
MGTLAISASRFARQLAHMIHNDLAYIVDADRPPLDPACKRIGERTGIYVQLCSRRVVHL